LAGPLSKRVTSLRAGGKGQRGVELKQVTKGRIELSTRNYGPRDAMCCPSLIGHSAFVVRSNVLEEIEASIEGGGWQR
jgi:hypothetical protein